MSVSVESCARPLVSGMGGSRHSAWAQTHPQIVDVLCQTPKSALSAESSIRQRSRRARMPCAEALLRLSVLWENLTRCCAVTANNARKMTPRLSILPSARP